MADLPPRFSFSQSHKSHTRGRHFRRFASPAGRKGLALTPLDSGQPLQAARHIVAAAMLFPYRTEGQRFGLLQKGEPGGQVPSGLQLSQASYGFQKGDQQRLQGGPGADDPRSHAIDARVEVVEAHTSAAEETA